VAEQTVISNLLRQYVFESIAALRRKPALLNEPGGIEPFDRTLWI